MHAYAALFPPMPRVPRRGGYATAANTNWGKGFWGGRGVVVMRRGGPKNAKTDGRKT